MKLDSGVFPVGTKITVSPAVKSSTYPPSSTGFVGSFSGQFNHSPNVAILNTSIIRKGKRGKQRIEIVHLAVHIFDIEMERKKIESNEFRGYIFVHMANTGNAYSSVMDMEPLEFLGWGTAHHTYIFDMYKEANVTGKWPKDRHNPVNIMGAMSSKFHNNPANALQTYADEAFRGDFVRTLRKMEASVAKTAMQYKLRTCSAELKAAAYLLWDNLTEKSELYDEKIVVDNYDLYRERYQVLRSLESNVNAARYKLSVKAGGEARQISKPIPLPVARSADSLVKILKVLANKGVNQPNFQGVIFNRNRGDHDQDRY